MLTFSIVVSVSLKAKLSPSELFTLIMDVQRRVETDSSGCKLGARRVIQASHPENLADWLPFQFLIFTPPTDTRDNCPCPRTRRSLQVIERMWNA